MLHCLKQSGEQDANIVFVNIRNPSGNLAARDNPTSSEYLLQIARSSEGRRWAAGAAVIRRRPADAGLCRTGR